MERNYNDTHPLLLISANDCHRASYALSEPSVSLFKYNLVSFVGVMTDHYFTAGGFAACNVRMSPCQIAVHETESRGSGIVKVTK